LIPSLAEAISTIIGAASADPGITAVPPATPPAIHGDPIGLRLRRILYSRTIPAC